MHACPIVKNKYLKLADFAARFLLILSIMPATSGYSFDNSKFCVSGSVRHCISELRSLGCENALNEVSKNPEAYKSFIKRVINDDVNGESEGSKDLYRLIDKYSACGINEFTYFKGNALINGYGVERDVDKGMALLKEVADKGFPQAQTDFALHALKIGRSQSEIAEALRYLELASSNSYGTATHILAKTYRNGWGGLVRDPRKAEELYIVADKQGYKGASFELAELLLLNKFETKNRLQRAREIFEKEQSENATAKYYLGAMYYFGDGGDRNLELGKKMIMEAAHLGEARAIEFAKNHF